MAKQIEAEGGELILHKRKVELPSAEQMEETLKN